MKKSASRFAVFAALGMLGTGFLLGGCGGDNAESQSANKPVPLSEMEPSLPPGSKPAAP